jgi:hypothetical protein
MYNFKFTEYVLIKDKNHNLARNNRKSYLINRK